LFLRASDIFLKTNTSENAIACASNGAVTLYYDNAAKLATTSTGVTVTGAATATTFLGDLNGTINTVTTAVTKANSTNDTTVATTAFVQNLIGTIPAGLVFQGTWNAATNTPTLTSGTGTTGNFYIVSVDGSTNLDGITDWKVGDWAVFVEQGAQMQWEKVDNSSVLDGSGTGQTLPLWSGSGTSNTLTDSRFTQSSTANIITGPSNLQANDSLRVQNLGGSIAFRILGDGIVNVPSNYLHVSNSQGIYSDGAIKARGGVTDDQGTLSLGGNNVVGNLILTGNTSAAFAGSVTTGSNLGVSGNISVVGTAASTSINRIAPLYGQDSKLLISNVSSGDGGLIYYGSNELKMFSYNDLSFMVGTGNVSGTVANERMRITQAGNVGIGTTGPKAKLEVAASVNGNPVTSGSSQTNGALRVRGSATNVLDIGQQSASPYAMWMQVCESTSLGVSYPLVINPNGGNVGIGTTAPGVKLTTQGASGSPATSGR
jgi:hypothetical protein